MSGAQGQSPASHSKMVRFASALAIGMDIFAGSKRAGFPYWHADTNAGCGVNYEVRDLLTGRPLDGSPIHAVREARKSGLKNFRAFFCDRDRAAAGELAQRLKSYGTVFFGDNEEFLRVFMARVLREERRPECATGSVLVDPNGWFYRDKGGKGPPVAALTDLCEDLPCIDVILNLNVSFLRNVRGLKRKGKWSGDKVPSAFEIMDQLNRENWLISDIEAKGGHHFVVMVGRNIKTGDHEKIGMHRVESAKGRAIIARINGESGLELEPGEQMSLAL